MSIVYCHNFVAKILFSCTMCGCGYLPTKLHPNTNIQTHTNTNMHLCIKYIHMLHNTHLHTSTNKHTSKYFLQIFCLPFLPQLLAFYQDINVSIIVHSGHIYVAYFKEVWFYIIHWIFLYKHIFKYYIKDLLGLNYSWVSFLLQIGYIRYFHANYLSLA